MWTNLAQTAPKRACVSPGYLCAAREKLERYADPEFWEVGASGTVYTPATVIATVEDRFRTGTEADAGGVARVDLAAPGFDTLAHAFAEDAIDNGGVKVEAVSDREEEQEGRPGGGVEEVSLTASRVTIAAVKYDPMLLM